MAGAIDNNKKWIRVVGAREIQMNLANLADPKMMGNKVLKPAIKKGLGVIRKRAKKKIRNRTGALGKSLKIEVNKALGGRVFVDPKFSLLDGEKLVVPQKYAHLVEFGRKGAPAHPFLRPARDEGREEAFEKIAKEAKKKFVQVKPGVY